MRDVVTYPNITADVLKKLTNNRPVFLVEDHEATYNPERINEIKNIIKSIDLNYYAVGEVKLFSPHVGHTKMHIYRVTCGQKKEGIII